MSAISDAGNSLTYLISLSHNTLHEVVIISALEYDSVFFSEVCHSSTVMLPKSKVTF